MAPGRLVCAGAAVVAAFAGAGMTAASAGAPDHGYGATPGLVSHGLDHGPGGYAARPGRGRRFGGTGDGSLGHGPAGPGFDRRGSGWYQRGFGGTRDPGWGNRFGPGVGGYYRH